MSPEGLLVASSGLLIGLSGLLVITGVVLIRTGRREAHKKAMLTACAFAAVFVVLYILRSSLYPPEKYMGPWRTFYIRLLISHTVLSVVNLPLVIVTVYLALKGKFETHKKVARFTAIVWVYVAFSGWAIHLINR